MEHYTLQKRIILSFEIKLLNTSLFVKSFLGRMEHYTLQKRIILSFETKLYEDGDTDYTYVVDASFNPDKTLVILTLSNGSIRILQTSDFTTVQSVETGRNNILSAHFVPCSPSHIVICYQNGCVDVHDTTSKANLVSFQVAKEIYSSALLCGGKMLVCGDKEHLYFNEVETGKQIGIYRDVHSDVINTLLPHPVYPTVFASGSEDGLICMFDIARGNLEDATVGVFQTESGVSSLGWFGGNFEMIWCASMTRGVSCWNTTTGSRDFFLADMAQLSFDRGLEVDYVVGCLTNGGKSPLILFGDQEGAGYLADVSRPDHVIAEWKGHRSAIRKALEMEGRTITCGEDASVCVWGVGGKEKKTAGVERKRHTKERSKQTYQSL